MKTLYTFLLCMITCIHSKAQADSIALAAYIAVQKSTSESFNNYFNKNIAALYGSNEQEFIRIIDSLRNNFTEPLQQVQQSNPGIDSSFFEEQYADLNYTFDKFILDYPPIHKRITGNSVSFSSETQARIDKIDISNAALLKYDAFRQYLQSVLEQKLNTELTVNRNRYSTSDNQRLDAGLHSIYSVFKNEDIRSRMKYELLANHIENYGVKNIVNQVALFLLQSKDSVAVHTIDSIYKDGMEGRKGHLITTYKTTGTTTLDLHIFKPADKKQQHPAIVFFHGGGWSEGMPDWFFSTCSAYAAKGWVAVAVEYRIRNRHGTLPPDAIADGKSAIRYLRSNAKELRIDPDRIVASGNSAGANLALAMAIIDTLDEKNENRRISSTPNAVLLNSVATDFTQGDFWQQYFKDSAFLKRISPLHQVRKISTPVLIVQGNRDYNVPLQPVIDFAEKMKAAGNDCELQVLEGAGHFIWYDRRFSGKVNEYREAFLERLGYR